MKNLYCLLFLVISISVNAQVAINTDASLPDNSAMLDVKSTTQGALLPRMTFIQRNAIASPAEGLAVICTNCSSSGTACFSIYLAGQWLNLAGNCDLPVAPLEGYHVQTNTQIVWNWTTVPIATGYKWNNTTDYSAATNMGTATTYTETGLITGNSFKRYVWAYNACGHSDSTIIRGQALTCGTSFTRNHTAGSVAPVTKTVTYGTVTNIPGETSKCWITRNLGATQQPNSVSDNTEAAAGWYWQFNQAQGYKHDGTIRTPNTTWITSINENSDWIFANDPCALLLGNAWRLPTSTEWINVDAVGGWTNWNGPFNSGLQMHAAGYLYFNDGSLFYRGSSGTYWSSTQSDATDGWYLSTFTVSVIMNSIFKEYGYSVRCIRD